MLIDLGKESRHNRRLKPFSLPAAGAGLATRCRRSSPSSRSSGLDRTGLLYELTRAISDLNLNIGSAHIGTYGEQAVDVFYVTDLIGHKIESKAAPDARSATRCCGVRRSTDEPPRWRMRTAGASSAAPREVRAASALSVRRSRPQVRPRA